MIIEPTIREIKGLIGRDRCNQLLKVIGFVMKEGDVSCNIVRHHPNGYLFIFKMWNNRFLDIYIANDKITYNFKNKIGLYSKYVELTNANFVIDEINNIRKHE